MFSIIYQIIYQILFSKRGILLSNNALRALLSNEALRNLTCNAETSMKGDHALRALSYIDGFYKHIDSYLNILIRIVRQITSSNFNSIINRKFIMASIILIKILGVITSIYIRLLF